MLKHYRVYNLNILQKTYLFHAISQRSQQSPYPYLTCSSDSVQPRAFHTSQPNVLGIFFFYYIYVLPEPIPREEGRGEYYNCAQSVFSVHFSPNGTSVCMAFTYSVIMLRISLRTPNRILLVSLLNHRHLFQQVQERVQQVNAQKTKTKFAYLPL